MSDHKSYGTAVFIFFVVVLLVSFSNIPLLYGYLQHPPHLKFMGVIAGVRDTNFYFMMMRQGDGWCPILQNYFATGEPNKIYHGFFWFLLGKISHIFGIGDLAVYHGARITATALLAPVAYYFISRFLKIRAERITALAMLSFGAGAGWIQMIRFRNTGILPFVPADIGTPEASSLFTLMTFPHLSVALILIALCFALVEASAAKRKICLAVVGGACGMALGFIHAVNLIVIYVALATSALVWWALARESYRIRSAVVFGTISIWPIAYYVFLGMTRPELLPQAPVRSPAPTAYLVGFAPLLILSAIHIVTLLRKRTNASGDILLICWVVTNSLMLYSYPLLVQEARAVLGLQMPLVILSSRAVFGTILPSIGLDWQTPERSSKRFLGALIVCLIVAFTFPSTCYNIFERVSRLKQYPEAFALTQEEYEALDFLRDTPGSGVVLSGEWIGNYVPRLTGRQSLLGQYDLPSRDHRIELAKTLFAGETPASVRQQIIRENGIGFIFHGLNEREFGTFKPNEAPYLKLIFHRNSVDIYRYEPQDTPAKDTHSP